VDAWNRADLDGFLDAYWDSSERTFFSNGRMFRGHDEIAALMRDRYKGGMGRLTYGEPHFEVVGRDVAVVSGEWAVQLPNGQERRGLGTAVVRKVNGRWRIVHDHSSFDMTAAPPEKKP